MPIARNEVTKQSHERRIIMIISRNFKRGFVLLFMMGLVLHGLGFTDGSGPNSAGKYFSEEREY
jgi:hypothetical protein